MAEAPQYRAFLSYSHADEAMARHIHARLESYHIEQRLIGVRTRLGLIPASLRKIFIDRNDFSGAEELDDATSRALDDSAALILLASPDSAASLPVRREVETFQARHPDRPVIPVLLRGAPKTAFPPSVPHSRLAPDWRLDNPDVVLRALAAWLSRRHGPLPQRLARLLGWGDLAFAKLVCALLGMDNPDLFYRRERRRQRQRLAGAALGAALLVGSVSGAGYWWSVSREQARTIVANADTIAQVEALVRKYAPVGSAQAAGPGGSAALVSALTPIVERAATDPRYAQALALLQAGKPAEAEPLLRAAAEEMEARARQNNKQAAEMWRAVGAIAGFSDPKRALDAYGRAVALDPENEDALGWVSELAFNAGDLNAAERYLRQLATQPGARSDGDTAWHVRMGLGDIAQARGQLPGALASFRDGLAIAERLAKADPGNAGWQRDVAVSHAKLGNLYRQTKDPARARQHLTTGRTIIAGLVAKFPDWAQWQRDLVWFDGQLAALGP